MGARVYAGPLGRFLAIDPIEGGATTNIYGYVDDPFGSEDLSGEFSFKSVVKVIAVVAVVTVVAVAVAVALPVVLGTGAVAVVGGGVVASSTAASAAAATAVVGAGALTAYAASDAIMSYSTSGKKNVGAKFPSEGAAKSAARADARSLPGAKFRGKCNAGDHFHVDFTRPGKCKPYKTKHYKWNK
jgi:hypothetical protein